MSQKKQPEAITFAAHGSRLENANTFVLELVAKLITDKPVNIGFLEMAQPSLTQAITTHIQSGQRHIRVIPLFFAPGKHTLQDIPAVTAQVTAKFPDIHISVDTFVGTHPDFLALLQTLL